MSTSKALSVSSPVLNFSTSCKLPVILQSEATECGLACLAMVAGYYGFDTDLGHLRRRYGISAQGVTLKQLIDIAGQMNLSSRALRVDLAHLHQLQFPCILHWDMKHFVVAKKCNAKRLVIHDPAIGETSVSMDEVANLFTGVVLELTPSAQFQPGREKSRLKLAHFWHRIVGLKRSLSVIIVLSVMLQIIAIINPYYMQIVIDDVILRTDLNLLTVLAVGFAMLLALELGINLLRQFVIVRLSSMLNLQMGSNVFAHLIRLPMGYFSKRQMGDIVSRFNSINAVRDMITRGSVAVLLDGLMAILTLVVMFVYSAQLALLVLLVVAAYGALRIIFYRPLLRANEQAIVSSAKENTHFMESVRAIQTIKLFEKESLRQNQWQNTLADKINKDIRIQQWNISFETANKALFGIENILVVYFAATAVTENLLTVGMLYAFISYKTRFIAAMDSLIANGIEFRMLNLHFERLADMVFTPADPLINAGKEVYQQPQSLLNSVKGEIQLKNLGFSFSRQDKPLFENLELTINAGQTIALVGPSGCGKSTLLKCMMGLLEPSEGDVLVDDKSITLWSGYRQHIAAVMQDDQLLSGTIADNIACFTSHIDMQRICYCANLACMHEEIMAMPMQYNTLVGDMGASLSGGQKQRIMLARALYKQPKILFLDEATSHLDIQNESAINQHIKQLSITRVIVAHRPDTIAVADTVIKLIGGQLRDVTQSVKTQTNPSI